MDSTDLGQIRQKALDEFYARVPSTLRRSHLNTMSPFIRDPYYLTHPLQFVSPFRRGQSVRRHQDEFLAGILNQSMKSFEPLDRVPSSALNDRPIGVTHFSFDRAGSLMAVSTGSGVVCIYDVDELQLSFRNKSTSSVTPVLRLETGRSVSCATFLSSSGGIGSEETDEDCLAIAFTFGCQMRIYRLSVCLSKGPNSSDSYMSIEAQGRGRDGGHQCLLAYSPANNVNSRHAAADSHYKHMAIHQTAKTSNSTPMLNLNNPSRIPHHLHNTNNNTKVVQSRVSVFRSVRLVVGGDLGWLRCWTVSRTGHLITQPTSPDWNFPLDTAPLLALFLINRGDLCVLSGKNLFLLDPSHLSPPTLAAQPQPMLIRKRELGGTATGGACLQDRVVVAYEGSTGVRVFCLPCFTPIFTLPLPISSSLPTIFPASSSSGEVVVSREGLREILAGRAGGEARASTGAALKCALAGFPTGRGGGPMLLTVRGGKLQPSLPLSTLSSSAAALTLPHSSPTATPYIRSSSFTLTLPPRLAVLSAEPGDCRLVLAGDPSPYLCASALAASAPAHSHRLLVQFVDDPAEYVLSVRSIVGTTVHTEEPWSGQQIAAGFPLTRLRAQLLPHIPTSLATSQPSFSASSHAMHSLPSAASTPLSPTANEVTGITALCTHPSLPLLVVGDVAEKVWLAPLVRMVEDKPDEDSFVVPAQRMRVIRTLPSSPLVAEEPTENICAGCEDVSESSSTVLLPDISEETQESTKTAEDCMVYRPPSLSLSLDGDYSDNDVDLNEEDAVGDGTDGLISCETNQQYVIPQPTMPAPCPLRATTQAHLIDLFRDKDKDKENDFSSVGRDAVRSDSVHTKRAGQGKIEDNVAKKFKAVAGSAATSKPGSRVSSKDGSAGAAGTKQTQLSIFFRPKNVSEK
eukprot:gene26879-32484_t